MPCSADGPTELGNVNIELNKATELLCKVCKSLAVSAMKDILHSATWDKIPDSRSLLAWYIDHLYKDLLRVYTYKEKLDQFPFGFELLYNQVNGYDVRESLAKEEVEIEAEIKRVK